MTSKRGPIVLFLGEYPFSILLASLLVMILGAPFAGQVERTFPALEGEASIAPFVLLLTLGAAFSIWHFAGNRAVAVVMGGLVLVFLYMSTFLSGNSFQALHLIGQLIFLCYIITEVTRIVFRARIIDGNILCGAACIYLLIGVLFGFGFALVDLIHPGSFILPSFDERTSANSIAINAGWLMYFSLTTLTTVSFGDILPASEMARSMATLESIVGQIVMVLMMARLVGLHVAQTATRTPHAAIFEVGDDHPHGRPKKE